MRQMQVVLAVGVALALGGVVVVGCRQARPPGPDVGKIAFIRTGHSQPVQVPSEL